MKDKSTMSLGVYLLECLLYIVITMIWYKNLLFRCLPGRTLTESKNILWMMIGFSVLMCAFVLNRRMRTGWTVTAALAVPLGLYTVLTYIKTVGIWITIILVCAAVSVVFCFVLLMTRKFKNPRNKSKIIRRRLQRCCVAAQSIITIALLVIMLTIGVQGIFGDNILNSSVSVWATANNPDPSQIISNNMDTILLLQEEEWLNLTTQAKLNALQTIANIEADYMGLPDELNVGAANLDEYTLACYNDRTHTISIDLDHLENDPPYDILNSCCHEAQHAYQHSVVSVLENVPVDFKNLRLFREAYNYAKEFENYESGRAEFDDYYYQDCEEDAREYAEERVINYYQHIEEYLRGNK